MQPSESSSAVEEQLLHLAWCMGEEEEEIVIQLYLSHERFVGGSELYFLSPFRKA